ncbi:hypothetical protein ACJJTC_013996 [Scirpophaga incertulas]
MASKVLVPTAPFAKLQIKKSPPEPGSSGFIIGGSDAAARVAHLEHSVRFLQEQHRQMLSGLHAEIEALRERNRDLQFQLIFNKEIKEALPKSTTPQEDCSDSNEEAKLKRDIIRLELEAGTARCEARAAEARALQLQRLLDAQKERVRELEAGSRAACGCAAEAAAAAAAADGDAAESRAELRARLADAERLVRRLRADADRQRRELQCMKNSLHASLRASGLDSYGYQNNYHFPPVNTTDFWREPIRDEFSMGNGRGRGARRPLTLPELAGQSVHRSTIYANHHTRPTRANGYEHKTKKGQTAGTEMADGKSCDDQTDMQRFRPIYTNETTRVTGNLLNPRPQYPELKIVVTKLIPLNKGEES